MIPGAGAGRLSAVTVVETLLVFVGIPLAIVAVLALLIFVPGGRKRSRYKSGQPWEHEPVWYEPHPGRPRRWARRGPHARPDGRLRRPRADGAARSAAPAGPGDGRVTAPLATTSHRRRLRRPAMTRVFETEPHDTATRDTAANVIDEEIHHDHVFSYQELARLDEALTMSSRETGLRFTLYIGDLGKRTRIAAEEMHAPVRRPTRPSRCSSPSRPASGWSRSSPARPPPAGCPTAPARSPCCR